VPRGAFIFVGESAEQHFGDDDAEHPIAEKFQTLIVGAPPDPGLELLAAPAATGRNGTGMQQGDAQQLGVLEGEIQRRGQFAQIRFALASGRGPALKFHAPWHPGSKLSRSSSRAAASGAR
jgi:hypothetical protein